jgi:hypothetical protein
MYSYYLYFTINLFFIKLWINILIYNINIYVVYQEENMNGIKIELCGIGVILLGIALSTNNIFGYVGGIIGFLIIIRGLFINEDKNL